MPADRGGREFEKFRQTPSGKTVVAVTADTDAPMPISGAVTGSFSASGLTIGGLITQLSIDASAWYPAPTTALADRNNITVQNISGNGGVVLWNYSGSAPATEGFRIEDGGFKSVAITETIPVFLRMLSGSGTVTVDEVA
jgi:hypothetical protein